MFFYFLFLFFSFHYPLRIFDTVTGIQSAFDVTSEDASLMNLIMRRTLKTTPNRDQSDQ